MQFKAHIKKCNSLLTSLFHSNQSKTNNVKEWIQQVHLQSFHSWLQPNTKSKTLVTCSAGHCRVLLWICKRMTVQHLDGAHSQLRLPQKTWDMRRILFSDHEKTTHRVHVECTLDYLQKHRSCILCYAHRLV